MTRPDFVQSLAKPQRPHEEEALEGICDPANLADVDGTAPESLPPITPRMEAFSPAESLESNVTLVSAGKVVDVPIYPQRKQIANMISDKTD